MLESESQADKSRFAPGAPEKRDSDGQARNRSRSYVDVGIARDRGGIGASAGKVVPIDQVGQPCGTAGGGNDCVEVLLVHSSVYALGASQLMVLFYRVEIGFFGKQTLSFGFDE